MAAEWSDLPERAPKATCSHCYAGYPRDEMEKWQGSLLCRACLAVVRTKTTRINRAQGPEVQGEAKAPTLSNVPEAPRSSPTEEEEDRLRSQLVQLEHEKRRRPGDPLLLRDIADLYEKLGDKEEAAIHRDEYLRLAPLDPVPTPRAAPERPRVPPPPRPAGPVTPFWEEIPHLLRFPTRGRALAVLVGGGGLLGTALTISWFSIFGYLITIPVLGYIGSYFFSTICSSAAGEREAPGWPDPLDAGRSLLQPLLSALACILIPFGPFLLFLVLSVLLFGFHLPTGLLLVVLFLAGLFTTPMVLLVHALYGSISQATSYRLVFGSMGKVLPDYILLFTGVCILASGKGVADILIAGLVALVFPFPVLGTTLFFTATSLVFLYSLLVTSQLIGRFYRQSAGRLDWFGEAVEPMKELTPPVAIAGVAGAALLVLLGFVGIWALPGLARRAFGAGVLPLEGGTYLLYDIYDSNSGRSAVRYDIEEVKEGFRIDATGIMAGRSALITRFTVTRRGKFVSAPPSQEGPIFVPVHDSEERRKTILCGPRGARVGGEYLNGYPVRKKVTWKGWGTYRVENPHTLGTLYYDRSTGYLVGADHSIPGRDRWAVLSETNISGLEP